MCSQTGGFPVLLQLTSPYISHLCIWIAYGRFSSPTFWFSLGTYFPLQPELDLWRVWLYQSLVVARQEGRSWASAFLFIGFVFLSCSETHNHPLQCYYIAIKWTKDKNFLLSSHDKGVYIKVPQRSGKVSYLPLMLQCMYICILLQIMQFLFIG